MNRAKLLAVAKANGYTGEADLAKIKTWLTEQGIDLHFEGKAVDIDAAWKVTKAVNIEADATEDETEVDPDGTKEAEKPAARPGSTRPGQAYGKSGIGKVHADAEPVTRSQNPAAYARMMDRKSYNQKAAQGKTVFPDAEVAEAFASSYRFLVAKAMKRDYDHQSWDFDVIGKAGSTAINANSGALVAPEFTNALLWLTEQYGVGRKLFAVQPMKSDVWTGPRKTGIFTMAHTLENGTFTATNNTYDNISLVAKKVGALIQDSSELLEDAANSGISIADDYARTFAEAQAIREDSDLIIGDGSATYGGHAGLASALPSGAYLNGTGSAWSSLLLTDFTNAIGSVEYVDPSRLAWLCSRQFFFQVMLKLSTIGSSAGYLGGGNTMNEVGAGVGSNYMFLGYPVYFSQIMATATGSGSTTSVYFGDFKGVGTLGDRRSLSIKSSEHYAFNADQITVLGTARIAVNIHGAGRAETYGPVVGINS